MIKFKIKGAKVLSNKFRRASEKVDDKMRDVVDKESYNLLKRTQRSAPYKSSKLVRSFKRREDTSRRNVIAYKVGSDLYYAPFQEFGVKIDRSKFNLASVHVEFTDFAAKFKSEGEGKSLYDIKARKYFLPNYILARRAISRKTKTVIKNLMK